MGDLPKVSFTLDVVHLGPWRSRHRNPAFEFVVRRKACSLHASVCGGQCVLEHSATVRGAFSHPRLNENKRRYNVHCAFWDNVLQYMTYFGFKSLFS